MPSELKNTWSFLIALAIGLCGAPETVRTVMSCSAAEFEEYRRGRKEVSSHVAHRLLNFIEAQAEVNKRVAEREGYL
jgi:hypothetical protein